MRVPHVKHLTVLPNLPAPLAPLQEMAHNLWYSWHPEFVALFERLDLDTWITCNRNPVRMLASMTQAQLEDAASNETFLANLRKVYDDYREYLQRKKWFAMEHASFANETIAYFSLEYGMDTSLPVYSGGLGVLSGDTLKSASDLGLPMVAIGLLYRYGYFRQELSADGWQLEKYDENDWYHMPVTLVRDNSGKPVRIALELDSVPVQVQVWRVTVGQMPLYLLDTNIQENSSKAREITSMLYGGDRDMRIRQEIVLGIGGMKALSALGIEPTIIHSNEGHSWFLTLERLQRLMIDHKMSFSEASNYVWSTTVFTTHTPVPAGNERFDPVLVRRYLGKMVQDLGISWSDFVSIGRVNAQDDSEQFGMTVAALRSSAYSNGVSQLHGSVSRRMWHNIWPELPLEEVPIRAVTNGVHPASWLSAEMSELYETYLGRDFVERPGDRDYWESVKKIPDADLWRAHLERRKRLVYFTRRQLRRQLQRQGASPVDIQHADQVLDPDILTIGFARRFSTYKRGNLIFRDLERLERLLSNPERPVQLVISGKAHPLDQPGKEIIKEIATFVAQPAFRNRIVFLENYNIQIGRRLYQGCDVWLNNPRRPQEASGTSGMKAALNGALNVSVLDGWWDEAYSPEVGFKIGKPIEYTNVEEQDTEDAASLYSTLEREVVPLFYRRNENNLPEGWIKRMKAAIIQSGRDFSAHRMLVDYTTNAYLPAMSNSRLLRENDFERNRSVASWFDRVSHSWDHIAITNLDFPALADDLKVGDRIPVRIDVQLGDITPDDVSIELVSGSINSQEEFLRMDSFPVAQAEANGSKGSFTYTGEVVCRESGRLGITARVVPVHDDIPHAKKPKLIRWW